MCICSTEEKALKDCYSHVCSCVIVNDRAKITVLWAFMSLKTAITEETTDGRMLDQGLTLINTFFGGSFIC